MKIELDEIKRISDIPPVAWNFDIVDFVHTYMSLDSFHMIVAKAGDDIVGTGNVFIAGESSWMYEYSFFLSENILIQKV